jgi:hypothetical protein
MIVVFGEGRGFRVVWLLEEMGLAYRLRSVDLLAGVEKDPEFLAINPGGSYPQYRTATSQWSSRLQSWSIWSLAMGQRRSRRSRTMPPSLATNSSFISGKPASQFPLTTSAAPATLRPRPIGRTGALATRSKHLRAA